MTSTLTKTTAPLDIDVPAVATRPARPARSRSTDEYLDVVDMFDALRGMPVGSNEYRRQRERIIRRCMPMADHVALHFDRRGEALDDLVQVARVGLLNAVERFDPTRGSSFVAFAIPTMMGEVRRHFRDHAWAMHVPRRIRDLHVQITRATSALMQELGHSPTPSELAAYLGADREHVVECLISADAYQLRSLDAPIGSDGVRPRMVADVVGDVDDHIEHVTDREAIRPLLAALCDRDRDVLQMRFFDSMTQSQIAAKIGTSQMQVSRILARILADMRIALE